MSAHAYIQWADVPQQLMDSGRQHVDSDTKEKIVAFDGCPLKGQLWETKSGFQVEYSFPRDTERRHALVDWFWYHGIHFTVVM
jgi:hypothetical protein